MQFKLGDRVKVIDSGGCHEARMGDIGIIVRIDDSYDGKCILEVKRERDGEHLRMFWHRYKLIEPEDKFAYLKKIKKYGIVKFMEKINA